MGKDRILIIDAHEDLAWNMLSFGRDYRRSSAETRQSEAGTDTPARNGDTLLGWPDYQRGRVGVVFGTLFAAPARRKLGEWDTQCYQDANQAHAIYQAQLDAYHRLADQSPDQFRLVQTQGDLQAILSHWERTDVDDHPVGLVILMEGAEGVRTPPELEAWWQRGVRIIGPAWAGTRFCGGTREPGPLTKEGYALLETMVEFGFALDLSHMDEKAAQQALDVYPGTVLATHANAAALLKDALTNRHLPDAVIRGVIACQGVIGIVPVNHFLVPGWKIADGRQATTLRHVAAHIDYICQMAGDARHAGLGSDFDGGFGLQSVPAEIDSIGDLPKLAALLTEKGYSDEDIGNILGGNWLSILKPGRTPSCLPEAL